MTITVNYPYTMANGMIADGNQVMANFNAINTQGLALAAPAASPVFTGTITAPFNSAGYVYSSAAGVLTSNVPASAIVKPANPTGTTNTGGLMAGIQSGVSTITPTTTGRLLVIVVGQLSNSLINDGAVAKIYYGTGTGPANAASLPGGAVLIGASAGAVSETLPANAVVPFALAGYVSGLTVGQAYWFDLLQAAITGGTASLSNITMTVVEI